MISNNTVLYKTDSYKLSHFLQFPEDAVNTFYYIESRGGGDEIEFVGLQPILKKWFMEVPTEAEVYTAAKFYNAHGLPFNIAGWLAISQRGYLPLRINAVKEGSIVPTKQPIVTVTATEEGFEWLPGWCETMLMQVWYPITVATKSWQIKKIISKYLIETGDLSGLPFKLHDFGYRGVSSQESAELGGLAHLVNFMGTDNIAAITAAQEYYNTDEMVGFSIPAAEHSTITSWGRENESGAYKNMLDKFARPNSLVAVVSDSYDLNNAVKNIWGKELKQQVLESGATIVIRPDSGEPKEVVVRTLKQLDEAFGSVVNEKGFKVLNPAVRLIQGDGISSPQSVEDILYAVVQNGFSADNIAFGMGGGLLQQVNRDTFKFAMKLSAIKRGNEWYDAFKCPVDAPWKASKGGRFEDIQLDTVYENGKLLVDWKFQEIIDNSNVIK